jgi:hypothetical protein
LLARQHHILLELLELHHLHHAVLRVLLLRARHGVAASDLCR